MKLPRILVIFASAVWHLSSLAQTSVIDFHEDLDVDGQDPACESFSVAENNEANSINRWVACRSKHGVNYLLTGMSGTGKPKARFSYKTGDGGANISVSFGGAHGEINSEYISGTLILDAVYSNDRPEKAVASGAQLSLAALDCVDFPGSKAAESSFWSTSGSRSQGAPSTSLMAFYRDPAAAHTAQLVGELLAALEQAGILEKADIPIVSERFREFGVVGSSFLSFALMDKGVESGNSIQGLADCALLALGATGAIIGAIQENPSLGVTCSSACGGALTCLATLGGGGSVGAGCGAVTGGCLYCVGVGYSKNLSNCFRTFTEMY